MAFVSQRVVSLGIVALIGTLLAGALIMAGRKAVPVNAPSSDSYVVLATGEPDTYALWHSSGDSVSFKVPKSMSLLSDMPTPRLITNARSDETPPASISQDVEWHPNSPCHVVTLERITSDVSAILIDREESRGNTIEEATIGNEDVVIIRSAGQRPWGTGISKVIVKPTGSRDRPHLLDIFPPTEAWVDGGCKSLENGETRKAVEEIIASLEMQ